MGGGRATGFGEDAAVERVVAPRPRELGGMMVRRILPAPMRRAVGPFVFLDEMGPADFDVGAAPLAIEPHPHIGLATVTYLFEGEIVHRDSLGVHRIIHPGDVNWMTAGRGIVHSERSRPELAERRWRLHGLQSWLALPVEHEETEPAFVHHPADSLPVHEGDGVWLRLVAGRAFGLVSPVETLSEVLYADVRLEGGAVLEVPPDHVDRGVYVVGGVACVGEERYEPGRLVVFRAGGTAEIRAVGETRLMLLGGTPLGERFMRWNFVSSRRERLDQAEADWRERRMPEVPGDDS